MTYVMTLFDLPRIKPLCNLVNVLPMLFGVSVPVIKRWFLFLGLRGWLLQSCNILFLTESSSKGRALSLIFYVASRCLVHDLHSGPA
jgi:hypothetical protein